MGNTHNRGLQQHDLSGLAQDREMEFVIDLEPTYAPVHRGPYRMALTGLN